MPAIQRQDILGRLRSKRASGRPIIGGGAGTGLSAKCEEAGGIDVIVIYNSGRYRVAGRGSPGTPLSWPESMARTRSMIRARSWPSSHGSASPRCRTSPPSGSSTARSGRTWRRRA
jgi:predicted TIM-barrel enzyme